MLRFLVVKCLLIFMLPQMAVCQTTQLQVIDKSTDKAIENAHITYSEKHVVSDFDGKVTLKIDSKTKISISHISYCDTSIFVSDVNEIIPIALRPKVNTLPAAHITGKPVRFFAPAKTHVFDFEFWRDSLLVMTYEREKLFRRGTDQSETLYIGCKLLLISPNGSIIDSIPLPDLITGFHKDPLNHVFILSKDLIVLIDITKGKLSLSKIEFDEFDEFIKPLNGCSQSTYFFNDFEWDYPEFSYYGMDKNSKSQYQIRTIRDEFTMELFRAEYKYLSKPDKLRARKLEYETGIDKEIFGAYMSGFAYHPYYQELYAPLFSYGDSVIIFDHHSKQVFLHNGLGSRLDSIGIYYLENRRLKFKDDIVSDSKTNSFYGVFERSGIKVLQKIDPFSGDSGEVIDLYYPYAERIKIRSNKIYYIYRKTGGSLTKHLFVQLLY